MAVLPETLTLMLTRRSGKVTALGNPGPSPAELELILSAAIRVPDHGKLAPWRLLLFKDDARAAFGEILRRRFLEVRPDASAELADMEARRFLRAPLVIAVISRVAPGMPIPEWEQQLSAGAVCQNTLIAATSLGYAACWLTGWCAYDPQIGEALGLQSGERVAGFIYIGTASFANPERPRPLLSDVCRAWQAAQAEDDTHSARFDVGLEVECDFDARGLVHLVHVVAHHERATLAQIYSRRTAQIEPHGQYAMRKSL